MPKKISHTIELAEGLGLEKQELDSIRDKLADRSVSGMLAALRVKAGLTQKDFAKRIGRSQSAVSKIEATDNAELRIGDLLAYASAVGMNVSVDFLQPRSLAQEIKLDVIRLEKHLGELERFRQADGTVSSALDKFRSSITSLLFDLALKNLPEHPETKEVPLLSVESPTPDGSPIFK